MLAWADERRSRSWKVPHLVILGTFLDRFATRASATLPLGTASQALGPVGAQLTSLERVMRDADVVVCLAPLTPGTHRMIGAAELA